MSEVDFLVKLRDAAAMILDACQERLSKLASPRCERAQINLAFDPAKLKWEERTGPKGSYEICTQTEDPEFKKMMTILEAGGDRTVHLGMFYWIMTNRTAVSRKQK